MLTIIGMREGSGGSAQRARDTPYLLSIFILYINFLALFS